MTGVEPYDKSRDREAAFRVWQTAFGDLWPLTPALFDLGIGASSAQNYVAIENDSLIGIAATQLDSGDPPPGLTGYIVAIAVAPEAQGRGTAALLHDAALKGLEQAGARYVQLGGGRITRFWPGVPQNLPTALDFFKKRGWQEQGVSYDLVQRLGDYRTPARVADTIRSQKLVIGPASAADVDELLDFEAREFRFWHETFAEVASLGDYGDLLIVRGAAGRIVGSLVMYGPQSHPERTDILWKTLLGESAGSLGSVGVAASDQGKGIGLAMMARGSEILRERGVDNCYIGWTGLLDFYGKLGYTRWQSYSMSTRELKS